LQHQHVIFKGANIALLFTILRILVSLTCCTASANSINKKKTMRWSTRLSSPVINLTIAFLYLSLSSSVCYLNWLFTVNIIIA